MNDTIFTVKKIKILEDAPNQNDRIIGNVRKLSSYVQDVYLQTEDYKFFFLESHYRTFHSQIEFQYKKWFPRAKQYTDFDIVSQVFRDNVREKDVKTWVRYSLACLLRSSERVFQNVKLSKEQGDDELFKCELTLLREMSFEAAILMQVAYKVIEDKKMDFGHGKRFHLDSMETFAASREILRTFVRVRTMGHFALSPTSIFLIRQSIELWLQSIFGIRYLTDERNELMKLQPEILFQLIDNDGQKVRIPVPKAVIQKIHKWTQYYVHAGITPYVWEIDHAHSVLAPIHRSDDISIQKAYYDSIPQELERILKKPNIKVHRSTRTEVVLF